MRDYRARGSWRAIELKHCRPRDDTKEGAATARRMARVAEKQLAWGVTPTETRYTLMRGEEAPLW